MEKAGAEEKGEKSEAEPEPAHKSKRLRTEGTEKKEDATDEGPSTRTRGAAKTPMAGKGRGKKGKAKQAGQSLESLRCRLQAQLTP